MDGVKEGSAYGFYLTLIGGILEVVIGAFIIYSGVRVKSAFGGGIIGFLFEGVGKTFSNVLVGIGIYGIVMGLVLVGISFLMRKNKSLKFGSIIGLIVSIIGLNLLGLIGGIIGIFESIKMSNQQPVVNSPLGNSSGGQFIGQQQMQNVPNNMGGNDQAKKKSKMFIWIAIGGGLFLVIIIAIILILLLSGGDEEGNVNPDGNGLNGGGNGEGIVVDEKCDDIQNKDLREYCLSGKGSEENLKKCDAQFGGSIFDLFTCAALEGGDSGICNQLSGTERDLCVNAVAEDLLDPKLCLVILDQDLMAGCYTFMALYYGDASHCDSIRNETLAQGCRALIGDIGGFGGEFNFDS